MSAHKIHLFFVAVIVWCIRFCPLRPYLNLIDQIWWTSHTFFFLKTCWIQTFNLVFNPWCCNVKNVIFSVSIVCTGVQVVSKVFVQLVSGLMSQVQGKFQFEFHAQVTFSMVHWLWLEKHPDLRKNVVVLQGNWRDSVLFSFLKCFSCIFYVEVRNSFVRPGYIIHHTDP